MASNIENLIRGTVTKGVMKVADFNREHKAALKKPHPYLTGIHEPMASELTLDALQVKGSIPEELDGRYIRIGPNPATPPSALRCRGLFRSITGKNAVVPAASRTRRRRSLTTPTTINVIPAIRNAGATKYVRMPM